MENKKNNTSSAYNAGILQGKAYRILQNHLTKVLLPYSISIPEWKILGQLYDRGELKVIDLADILSVDPPLITKLVHKMETEGFIEKKSHKTDKRITLISPTKKGLKIIPELEMLVKEHIRKLMNGITPEEFHSYVKVLMTIVKQGELLSVKHNYEIE